jgi:tetratricopeptide (TPR) repeat protein
VLLSAEAKAAKMKEAEEYKNKAKSAMSTGFLKRPDPLAGSTYYKRAADCYKAAGEVDLERYFRVSSAQCNAQVGAWASAAAEYTAAADLAMMLIVPQDGSSDPDGRPSEQNCQDASNYHKQAAEAWTNQGDLAKAAQSQLHAALCLNASSRGTLLSPSSLAMMEEAVEAHVPDVLNPFARYRQTGHSAFLDPKSDCGDETLDNPSPQTLAMAKEHLVNRSYAHEPLQKLVSLLAGYGEYASALYASGAVSVLLTDGISTLSLSRAYVVETILQLAMGDPVAAEQTFLNRHCNSRSYLSSREAQLAEELTQTIKRRDLEGLEEVRAPDGRNRSALANLDPNLRALVGQLRISVRSCSS